PEPVALQRKTRQKEHHVRTEQQPGIKALKTHIRAEPGAEFLSRGRLRRGGVMKNDNRSPSMSAEQPPDCECGKNRPGDEANRHDPAPSQGEGRLAKTAGHFAHEIQRGRMGLRSMLILT